uniref:Uncharacterized protein n=1 Tax=Lactuca sativa TaxID=4236 RepID=A0A9R1XUT2_LACSA|nr:hypothetical protein LSAT_V11C100049520 [Lactuca sativa]
MVHCRRLVHLFYCRDCTILSNSKQHLNEGNYYTASKIESIREVTKRENNKNGGAYFIPSGYGSCAPGYSRAQSFPVDHGSQVPALTANAGQLRCTKYKAC